MALKEMQADTNFLILSITGRLLIGNHAFKEASRRWWKRDTTRRFWITSNLRFRTEQVVYWYFELPRAVPRPMTENV